MADIDWSEADLAVPYNALPDEGEWLMATGPERALIERLGHECLRLDDPTLCRIIVGIQTSGNHIYHLERRGTDRYLCTPKGKEVAPYEIEIEDAIMKPLVSGPEAKRYEEPETDMYLLFPYEADERRVMRLISADDMALRFPMAWAHLHAWRNELTKGRTDRENDWWGYVYRKNLDKQHLLKLLVAQTVPGMRVCADYLGRYYLDNVRVNGILPASGVDPSFLLGALNGPVADFVFRRISKPKQGGWYEANRQFIAPLPIPNVSREQHADVAARAHGSSSDGRSAAICCARRKTGSPSWHGLATRRAGSGPTCPH